MSAMQQTFRRGSPGEERTSTVAEVEAREALYVAGGGRRRLVANNLSVLAYTRGFTLWHYRAGDTLLRTVRERGFFDDALEMFVPGDMVMVSAADGGTVLLIASTSGGEAITMPLS